ncbi:MFS transporter [Dongia deserti]|uniref:MFS transporter n=1 Tax=Dongia deserti TaxID=2268030 RepID=UPI0013C466E2|nr:MFS transporter [Dongia deserti]
MPAWRLTLLLCLAEALNMAGYSAVAALLPELRFAWSLGNAEIGIVEGAFNVGYVVAVPILVTGTDRRDPRTIYLFATALGIGASLGLAFLARDLWSAALFRGLAGIALAGTYMPGLKILTDSIEGPKQSRCLAFYTASFSLGASASTAATGAIGHAIEPAAAFVLSALGNGLALLLVAALIRSRPGEKHPPMPAWGALWQAAHNRNALAYSLAYAAHMWELYGFRAWLVAYLLFAATGSLAPTGDTSYALWGAVLLLLGMPSSIIGNEFALKIGRQRQLVLAMFISVALALAFGAGSFLPFPLLLVLGGIYSLFVTADSASLTAGAVAQAKPGQSGATMALHSLLGFGAASLGPLAFGLALDIGGDHAAGSWFAGFAILGAGVACGPLILKLMLRTGSDDKGARDHRKA